MLSLGISYRDHITYEEMKARIGNVIRQYGDLLTSLKRRKLKWFGHFTRLSGQSYREQFKEGEEEATEETMGRQHQKSGLALNGTSYYGKPRTARSGGSWL